MKDLFSSYANDYARYRPQYPKKLFEYIYAQLQCFDLAWDCGTGNGQAAFELAKKFKQVHATDISVEQLAQAAQANNIAYAKEPAEQTSLADNSVDLITVAQALHWFNLPEFYKEVNRVAKPEALIVAWTYNLLTVNDKIDHHVRQFYFETLRNSWDAERLYVDMGYANIPFPYTDLSHPEFCIEMDWTLLELAGYISTWSGLKKYVTVHKVNPLTDLINKLEAHWPEGEFKTVKFPLFVRAAKVSSFYNELLFKK